VRQIVDDTIESFWREIDRLARLRPSRPSAPG
jgi:enoyl-[acyl-carrier protein] reductase II